VDGACRGLFAKPFNHKRLHRGTARRFSAGGAAISFKAVAAGESPDARAIFPAGEDSPRRNNRV